MNLAGSGQLRAAELSRWTVALSPHSLSNQRVLVWGAARLDGSARWGPRHLHVLTCSHPRWRCRRLHVWWTGRRPHSQSRSVP